MEVEVSRVNTRSHDINLDIPFPDNEFHKTMLFYRGAKASNYLPGQIKEMHALNRFKMQLKSFIKSTTLQR